MSWPLVPFLDVCNIQGGTQPPKSTFIEENRNGYIRLLQIQDFKRSDKAVFVPDRKSLKKCNENDILIGRYGASVGKVLTGLSGAYNVALVKTVPDMLKLDRGYLYHYLCSPLFQNYILNVGSRAAQAGFNKDDLASLDIPLPPLIQQKRIAAILDKADAIRRKRQQAIQLADDFLRAVFLDMFGDPVTNPKGFPIGTIRDLVETASYGSSAKASETEGEFPMLRMGNITYSGDIDFSDLKYVDLSETDQPKYLVVKGDLLFNRTNSKELVGKTAVYDRDDVAAIAGYLIRVRMNEKGNSYYVSGYLNSLHGKSTLQSMCKSIVGMANINAQEMQNIQILIPPIELQNKYAAIYQETKHRLKSQWQSENCQQNLFSALSQKAFSGNL